MTYFSVPMQLPRRKAALRDCLSNDAEVRWVAAQALGGVTEGDMAEVVEALFRLLGDPVEEVRAQALIGLAEQSRAGADVSNASMMMAFEDESIAVKTAALDCLDVMPNDVLSLVGEMLKDEYPAVRAAAATALGEVGAEVHADAIARLLSDEDTVTCECSAVALARLGDSRGASVLVKMLNQGGGEAVEAALLLGMLGDSANVTPLKECGGGWFSTSALRATCAVARVNCGDILARQEISKMLRAFRWSQRLAALQALATFPVAGVANDVAALIDSGRQTDASSAISVLKLLAEADDKEALIALQKRRNLLEGDLRDEIAEALDELEVILKKKGQDL